MTNRKLGRKIPTDFEHIEKYTLTRETTPTKPVPVVLGINWYSDFDNPVKKDGKYWIGLTSNLGSIRGGHAVPIKPQGVIDPMSWVDFYNQGNTGSCVGFSSSRMMSLLNRKRYDAKWLWHRARLTDEFTDNDDLTDDDQGTTVRAAMDVLRKEGHVAEVGGKDKPVNVEEGISANRWAVNVDQVLSVLQSPLYNKLEAVPIMNNWGRDYPHQTWMPLGVLQRLIHEDGEVALVTDR